jgi:toxin ParE1/3/4
MLSVRYTRKALSDLDEITAYSTKQWSIRQAEDYLDSLLAACRLISQHPRVGRPFDAGNPSLRRLEHASHVIIYSIVEEQVLVKRIQHKSRLLLPV